MDIKSYLKSASLDELIEIRDFLNKEIQTRQSNPDVIHDVQIYTDGAARGNPGPAGIGFLLFDQKGEKITQDFQYLGETTNNEAEYRALLLALDKAYDVTDQNVICYSDSQLMVRQLNGAYALKSEKLKQFYGEVKLRAARFASVTFTHVTRDHPKLRLADQLANRAIDEARPDKTKT